MLVASLVVLFKLHIGEVEVVVNTAFDCLLSPNTQITKFKYWHSVLSVLTFKVQFQIHIQKSTAVRSHSHPARTTVSAARVQHEGCIRRS
mmetsp:Transcript_838/g.2272  ORF Transcript_838/g.2272 Transcript_838/m.2272 type:complete len:90 (+) Transcript_838:20-289(+)